MTDVPTALEILASALSYCIEAGLVVQVKNDMRDPDKPNLILRLPNVLAVPDEAGNHIFKPFVPDPVPSPAVL